ncbi:hypothetical protein HUT11_04620 [Streptomyces seoulensis]|nr:hypothetical protein HUT11_04620 [Streptomyces seoulensis]
MKIRRALVAAAAAAAVAPAAVLAAPAAAFAAGPVAEDGPRTTASSDAPPPAESAPGGGGTGAERGDGSRGRASKGGGTVGSGGAVGHGRDQGVGDSSGAGKSCAFESGQVRVAVQGLPRRLAAGGAWSTFSMTLANTTGRVLEKVQPFLYVSSAENVDRPYWELETEYHDAGSGRWKTFHDATPDELFGSFAIGPHGTVTLQLRTHAVKTAVPGAGYVLASGDYRDGDGSCGSAKETWYDFTIAPAGAKPGGTAGPGDDAAPAGGTAGSGAAGGASPRGGGRLSTTGSSSALPAIALIGGAALVAGAGAVIGVRRRRDTAGPGGTDATT